MSPSSHTSTVPCQLRIRLAPRCDRNTCGVLLVATPLPKARCCEPSQSNPTQCLYYVHVKSLGFRLSKLVPKMCHSKVITRPRCSLLVGSYNLIVQHKHTAPETVPAPRLCLVVIRRCTATIFYLFIWYRRLVDQIAFFHGTLRPFPPHLIADQGRSEPTVVCTSTG